MSHVAGETAWNLKDFGVDMNPSLSSCLFEGDAPLWTLKMALFLMGKAEVGGRSHTWFPKAIQEMNLDWE